jgi:branched-subunit amino acid aminotransferase/4-amino-4-deoxychorismate lyase
MAPVRLKPAETTPPRLRKPKVTKTAPPQVLFLDAESATYIEELGGMNLFFVYADGRVATPALDGTILRGITRDSVIQLIKDRGLKVEERKITS